LRTLSDRFANLRRRALAILSAVALLWFAWDHPGGHAQPPHHAEWLAADDVTLRVLRAGSGDTTLLLLHGYGESLMAYRGILDRLAQRYRVVAVDLPGFGLSDKPDAPYDLPSMRRRLGDFLDRWTRGPVVVVGHSMGGEIAADLAISHPQRIVATVLISPAGYGLSPLLTDSNGRISSTTGWAASTIAAVLPVHDTAWLSEPADRARYDPVLDPAYRTAAARLLREFDFTGLRGRIGELRQPTLLIWGRQDPTIPFELGEQLAARLPCHRFVPLASTLHRPHESQPDTVAAEIEAFLHRPACGNPD
jgi:pimeloyl-ACP methyl ester carboxylesterase